MRTQQAKDPVASTVNGIDRLIRNVQTGRFERSLSALTAAGALVTAAEVLSRRMAKTALPLASAAIVANGLQGTWLHLQGIRQKPGGLSNLRYNLEMGPPLFAPLLVTMVGGMGLLASVLRREP